MFILSISFPPRLGIVLCFSFLYYLLLLAEVSRMVRRVSFPTWLYAESTGSPEPRHEGEFPVMMVCTCTSFCCPMNKLFSLKRN